MAKAIKATQKRINLIEQNTQPRPSEEIKLSKRRFFDLALKAKS
jgi:vacuolar-type H+-ATPase subunit D/Vma8